MLRCNLCHLVGYMLMWEQMHINEFSNIFTLHYYNSDIPYCTHQPKYKQ